MFRRKHCNNNNQHNNKVEIVDFETGVKQPFDSKYSPRKLRQIKEHFYKNPESSLMLKGYEFFELIGEIREQENQKAYDKTFDVIYELVTALKKKREGNESDKNTTVQESSPDKDNQNKNPMEKIDKG